MVLGCPLFIRLIEILDRAPVRNSDPDAPLGVEVNRPFGFELTGLIEHYPQPVAQLTTVPIEVGSGPVTAERNRVSSIPLLKSQ